MKEWVLFALFAICGLGMLILGLVYMQQEKDDPESVKIFRIVSIIGALLVLASILMKFVF